MEKVAEITLEEKESLVGQLVQPDWYFYPVQDCNNGWIISTEEIEGSIYPQNNWVKQLPLIDWCAPIPTPSGSTENYVGS
jgi:hypothetical protein